MQQQDTQEHPSEPQGHKPARTKFSVWLDSAIVERIDGECKAAEQSLPGSQMSRAKWIEARLRDYFAKVDARDASKQSKRQAGT